MDHQDNLQIDLVDLLKDGCEKIHILADFDGTLTKDFIDGKKVPSIISVLRDQHGYLSPEYQKRAKELYNTYSSFENDPQLKLEDRKEKMKEWWKAHDQLLVESGLNRFHINKVATSGIIQFKDGAKKFLELTNKLNIPVVIFSASGLGEAIPIYCEHENVKFSNIIFLINRFKWDSNGNAVGFLPPVIHSLNKDETLISEFSDIYGQIKERTNVLLLGNNPGDIGMIEGFEYSKLLSVGFVENEELDKKTQLEKEFDHVVVDGYRQINQVFSAFSK